MSQPPVEHPHGPGEQGPERLPGDRWIDRDVEHLRLLGMYHLIIAGINAVMLLLFVLVPLVVGPSYYETMGLPAPPPEQLLAGLLVGGGMLLVIALNGWSLLRRRNRVSCLILSVIECLFSMPVGLIMGISAIVVLRRESVKVLFAQSQPARGETAPTGEPSGQ